MATLKSPEWTATTDRAAYRLWNVGAGIALGLAASLSLPLVLGDLGAYRGFINWFTIFLGTFAAGSLFWWLLIGRPRRASVLCGVAAGILASVFAYPIVFLVMFAGLGEVPVELIVSSIPSRASYALAVLLYSIVSGGWLTPLAGASCDRARWSTGRRAPGHPLPRA